METGESAWTNENLLTFLASLKASIPKHKKSVGYRKDLETVDWNKVALPPFSPEECQEKWTSIMKNIPKIRTLAELISEAEDAIVNPSHNTKIHPELPKRPAPPNAVFFQENFAQLKAEHPNLTSAELAKISTEHFSNLTDEKRAEYEKKHRLTVKEYKRELKKFWNGYGKICSESVRRQKKKTVFSYENHSEDESGLPPKPLTHSYLLFCKEQSKSGGDGQKYGMMKKWSKAWQKLSHKEKLKYYNQGRELKRQYGVKLNNYLKRFGVEEQEKILKENGISRSATRAIKHQKLPMKLSNEPKMPSKAARSVFFSERMKLMKEIPLPKDRLIEAGKMWKQLSLKEKERYKAKVDEKFVQYTDQLQKWFHDLTPENQTYFIKNNPTKLQYLDLKPNKMYHTEELRVCQPSDSEDEDLVMSSSSDEEENILNFNEEEDEEEEDEEEEYMFEMY